MPNPDQLEIITAEGAVEFHTLDRAKGIINQAYGDVAGMVGNLPDLVVTTR